MPSVREQAASLLLTRIAGAWLMSARALEARSVH